MRGTKAKRGVNYRRHLRRVFKAAHQTYIECRTNTFSNSCAAIYDALGRAGGARPAYTRVKVRPTAVDYICDFELAARRTLNPDEWVYFYAVYICGDMDTEMAVALRWPAKSYSRFVNRIEVKVGAALKARGIYPFKEYFAPWYLK